MTKCGWVKNPAKFAQFKPWFIGTFDAEVQQEFLRLCVTVACATGRLREKLPSGVHG